MRLDKKGFALIEVALVLMIGGTLSHVSHNVTGRLADSLAANAAQESSVLLGSGANAAELGTTAVDLASAGIINARTATVTFTDENGNSYSAVNED